VPPPRSFPEASPPGRPGDKAFLLAILFQFAGEGDTGVGLSVVGASRFEIKNQEQHHEEIELVDGGGDGDGCRGVWK
jgi:hypothetical protein